MADVSPLTPSTMAFVSAFVWVGGSGERLIKSPTYNDVLSGGESSLFNQLTDVIVLYCV